MDDCGRAPGVSAIGGADQIYGKGADDAGVIEIGGLHVCVGQIEALRIAGVDGEPRPVDRVVEGAKENRRDRVRPRMSGVIGYGNRDTLEWTARTAVSFVEVHDVKQ